MTTSPAPRIHIRPAQAADASLAAKVIHMSMGKLADHLFDQDAQAIETMIAMLFARDAGRFGSGISVVAEAASQPVGMLFACPGGALDKINLATLKHFVPVLGIKHALKFIWRGITLPGGREAEKDEYYLSNLGIVESAQGRGFGSSLLEYAEQTGRTNGFKKCSLIVGLHNERAFRLYQRTGYQVVETAHHQNENLEYHRMVKRLN